MNWAGGATQPVLFQLSRLLPWLDVAWLLGVACLSIRTIGGWRMIERLRRSALVEAPEAVRANFVRLCQRLGITSQVSLRISGHVQGPLAMGIVRSLIILPASALMALTPHQLEAVLAHELEHVRRADYFWNLIRPRSRPCSSFIQRCGGLAPGCASNVSSAAMTRPSRHAPIL